MRTALAALVLLAAVPAWAETRVASLRWRGADGAGEAAWRALQAAMPDLAADARAARFRPAHGMRQITVDLDGDGRPEMLLYLDIAGWCGSAGCTTHVLTRGAGSAWRPVCMTSARPEDGIRLRPRDGSGWHGIDSTARITFERTAGGIVTCRDEALPRTR